MRFGWDAHQILLKEVSPGKEIIKLKQGETSCALCRGASVGFKMAARDLKGEGWKSTYHGIELPGKAGGGWGAYEGCGVKGPEGDLGPLGLLSRRLLRSSWRSLDYVGRQLKPAALPADMRAG